MDTPITKKLQEILEKKNFESLAIFANSQEWNNLQDNERLLLSKLFVKKAENELKNGNPCFLESLTLAERIAPSNATILYLKGKVFASQSKNPRCLSLAIDALEHAIMLEPHFFEALLLCGETLLYYGIIHQQVQYLLRAQQKFHEAFAFLEHQPHDIESRYFWKWGLSYHFMGLSSEEPHDFHQAIQKYHLAQQLGQQSPEFLENFGDALMELSELVKQHELCYDAIRYYELATYENHENYELWFKLASCYEKIYSLNGKLQYFELSSAAFAVAAKSLESNFFLWLRWGKLYLNASKFQKNNELAVISLEKFKKASEMQSDHPVLLGLWAEVEIIRGIQTERLELLRSAEQKILKSIQQISSNPHIWALYGSCLNELGLYFSDPSYYEKAIEKFRHSLTLNERDSLLWYGMAISYFSLGEYWGDSQQIETAVSCFQKAYDLSIQFSPQFWNDWGLALLKLAELTHNMDYLEAAIQKFELIIRLQDEELFQNYYEVEWLYNYGCALDFLGDFTEDVAYYEKAVIVLTKALQLNPNYENARYHLAASLSHLGEASSDIDILHSAIDHYQIILNTDPEDETTWNDYGLALLNIAELVYESTRPERSKTYYDEAEQKFVHALSLGSIYANYNLSCLYSLLHNFPSAMHYLERAEAAGALPALDDMLHDEWLENLVETPSFRQFISQISSKRNHLED